MQRLSKLKLPFLTFLVTMVVLVLGAKSSDWAYAQNKPATRVDTDAVQGVLAVRSLDGWLLTGGKKSVNPIAAELVHPEGRTTRQWFYFIPSFGQPIILVHKSEMSAFDKVPGRKVQYTGFRDLRTGLSTILKGVTTVAMEYAPKSGIASLTRVDAGTIAMVRKVGVTVQSSADLVQFTKSLWGPDGRLSHYVAVHHLSKIREEALAFVRERITANATVTEHNVQVFIAKAYRIRGISGQSSVSTGKNTAKPSYKPSKRRSAKIKRDQLLVLHLSASLDGDERTMFASISWVAYVGSEVPERYKKVFQVVAGARDSTVSFIADNVSRRHIVKGFEADQKARSEINKAGLASRFLHRTGHSLDSSLAGDGANLDDYETHDTRNLVMGAGFTVGPGIYNAGDFGMRSIVDVHIARTGVEVTTPIQTEITALFR
ncbi:MAG: M24 family metallopeptidase [Kofleriaceae bacterium]|nr:M24 family metallopeptidase [Kofleriaceae bacterium]